MTPMITGDMAGRRGRMNDRPFSPAQARQPLTTFFPQKRPLRTASSFSPPARPPAYQISNPASFRGQVRQLCA